MYVGLLAGLVVGLELLNLYRVGDVFVEGELVRSLIYVGWGINNNMGCMLVTSLPFAFYFIYKGDKPLLYSFLALFLCGAAVLTTSRGAIFAAAATYIVCTGIVIWRSKSRYAKRVCGVCTAVLACVGVLVLISSSQVIRATFALGLQSYSRTQLYELGLRKFSQSPIFGNSFYLLNDYSAAQGIWDKVGDFEAAFPERWHNTVVQLLASCGLAGLLAYVYHRYQTLELFLKKPNAEKSFIGGSLLVIVALSFIDCHFFNIGPTLFYSSALAVAEFSHKA